MPPKNICGQLSCRCITIDSTTNDEPLHNARIAFYGPTAVGPVHGTTSVAVSNLLSCLETPGDLRVMIVGHGAPGIIITGSGAVASDRDKRITVRNFSRWSASVGQLESRITELTFCSCETGAGDKGAELLMKVANHVKAIVSGFTGIIFVDATGNITCETGGQWQHAHANTVLSPVPAPVHKFGETVNLRLKYPEGFRTINISDVFAISFFDPSKDDKRILSLEGEAAHEVVRMVDFTEPSEIDGAPLALITGTLKIEYLSQEERDSRTFLIYNDRLLFDQSTPNVYYYASPALATALAKFRYESR
jgi:hypothetical protein